MPFDGFPVARLVFATCIVLLSYPSLYWFLRGVKGVPLRFNVTVFVAVLAAGLLPLEITGFEISRSASHLETVTMILSAEQRLNDMMLVCSADPAKVSPDRVGVARQRLVDHTATWFNVRSLTEITSAQWLKTADPCDDWVPREKEEQDRLKLRNAADWLKWWLIASVITGFAGVFATYDLVVSRMREDLREAKVEGRVDLKDGGETAFVAFICLFAFMPVSLLWLRLFRFPKKQAKPV
ncbi:hypothetical protein [Burkholderia sp. Ac-20365]|uniref:hypothetical protein n=1 Tax=Burkholderia sp. Ac-20365 TaxID=2703897 RepID=UPI00197BA06E|nr:hypothetical protein [Burkholderia sp. Ac-20365]MBN3761121.1 hypothetical protein [Burkholderia sp. Ac-20365]